MRLTFTVVLALALLAPLASPAAARPMSSHGDSDAPCRVHLRDPTSPGVDASCLDLDVGDEEAGRSTIVVDAPKSRFDVTVDPPDPSAPWTSLRFRLWGPTGTLNYTIEAGKDCKNPGSDPECVPFQHEWAIPAVDIPLLRGDAD